MIVEDVSYIDVGESFMMYRKIGLLETIICFLFSKGIHRYDVYKIIKIVGTTLTVKHTGTI